jgi:hyaluronan synthase
MGFKTWLFGFEMVGMTGAYVAAYTLPPLGYFSVYGSIMLTYFIVQTLTSYWNDCAMKTLLPPFSSVSVSPKTLEELEDIPLEEGLVKKVVLLVVGHRERPDYWKKCLVSVGQLDPSNLLKVYLCIDGIEEEDRPMYDMASEMLGGTTTPFEVEISRAEKRGKRGVMYLGIEKIRHDFRDRNENNLLVAVTDSDTELWSDALMELEKCIESHPQNGCATGLLTIYNLQDGLLPKLIYARYHYAFAMERACLSYFGCMTCCSGPLSMYRLQALPETIMKRFATQSLGGVQCEPGDDRHLTNLVMSQGYFSRQTSYAVAGTEAPETMIRFLLQQLRWSRSYYREIKWQIQCMDHQSYFLGFSTVYESLFPWFVLVWVLSVLYWPHPLKVYVQGLVLSMMILTIRTLFLFFRFRETTTLYNFLYYFMYFLFLLPTKIFAVMTLLNNTWVTQSRDTKKWSCSQDAILYFGFLGVWQVLLGVGLGCTIYRLW